MAQSIFDLIIFHTEMLNKKKYNLTMFNLFVFIVSGCFSISVMHLNC